MSKRIAQHFDSSGLGRHLFISLPHNNLRIKKRMPSDSTHHMLQDALLRGSRPASFHIECGHVKRSTIHRTHTFGLSRCKYQPRKRTGVRESNFRCTASSADVAPMRRATSQGISLLATFPLFDLVQISIGVVPQASVPQNIRTKKST